MRFGPVLGVIAAILAACADTSAQCDHRWVEMFSFGPYWTNSGTSDPTLIEFDGGAGPAIYTGIVDRLGDSSSSGVPANSSVRLGPFGWSVVTGSNGVAGASALCIHDDGTGPALYGRGSFKRDGKTIIAATRWTGTSWIVIGEVERASGTAAVVSTASFDDGSGPALYVSGSFTSIDGVPCSNIARWRDGTWTALPPTSWSGLGDPISNLTAIPCGPARGLYAVGSILIKKFDGTAWTNAGTGFWFGSNIARMVAFDFGAGPELVAGGSFSTLGGTNVKHLAVWNGTAWRSIGNLTTSAYITTVAALNLGNGPALAVGGSFSAIGGKAATNAAIYDGSTWTAMNLPGFNPFSFAALGTSADRRLYMSTYQSNTPIVRLWSGTEWVNAGLRGVKSTTATVLIVAPFREHGQQRLFAGGAFGTIGGTAASNAAMWNGSYWEAMGAGLDGTVAAAAAFDDGSGPALYVGGSFTKAGGAPASHVARWRDGAWQPLDSGIPANVQTLKSLYWNGHHRIFAGTAAGTVLEWTGSEWSVLDGATNGQVTGITVHDDGAGLKLYACGLFAGLFSGQQRSYPLKVWDGSTWTPELVYTSTLGQNQQANQVASIDLGQGPRLYVANARIQVPGLGQSERGIACWDGQEWSIVGNWFLPSTEYLYDIARFDGASGPELVAAGSFTKAGGAAVPYLAGWNGLNWNMVKGAQLDRAAGRLVPVEDDAGSALVVVGSFGNIGGVSASQLGYLSRLPSFPRITEQPSDSIARATRLAEIHVHASGLSPLSYQWQRNGIALADDDRISGATTNSLRISPVEPSDEGAYDVIVSNACNEIASAKADLRIVCDSDTNGDGFVSGDDFDIFVAAFEFGLPAADIDANGFTNGDDFDLFVAAFETGC